MYRYYNKYQILDSLADLGKLISNTCKYIAAIDVWAVIVVIHQPSPLISG